jgi:hypothetical protein
MTTTKAPKLFTIPAGTTPTEIAATRVLFPEELS